MECPSSHKWKTSREKTILPIPNQYQHMSQAGPHSLVFKIQILPSILSVAAPLSYLLEFILPYNYMLSNNRFLPSSSLTSPPGERKEERKGKGVERKEE